MMSPDMQAMGPNLGPPTMGPGGAPMMGGFSGDGGAMPPGAAQGGANFFNNFFNQQEGMNMEGGVQEGESRIQIL